VTRNCGHPVTKLVYFKSTDCLRDVCWTYSDNSYCVVARLLHVYTFSVLSISLQTEIAKGSAVRV
jgi:hypothetical protein